MSESNGCVAIGASSWRVVAGIIVGALAMAGCGVSTTDADEPELGEASDGLAGTDRLDMIAVRFHTGGDDKRSDSQVFFNVFINGFVNQFSAGGTGATWPNWTWTDYFFGRLPAGTRNMDIGNFWVTWSAGSGSFIQTGDNWNMEHVEIWVWDSTLNGWQFKGQPGGDPLQRFTGSTTLWSWGGWPL